MGNRLKVKEEPILIASFSPEPADQDIPLENRRELENRTNPQSQGILDIWDNNSNTNNRQKKRRRIASGGQGSK